MKTSKPNRNLCQFPFADGRSCRMPRSQTHDYLCVFHADRERRLLEQQCPDAALAEDLLGSAGELRTSTDINTFLSRLTKHAIAGRIHPQLFGPLVYSVSLLLQTLPDVRNDITVALGFDEWKAEIRRLYSSRKNHKPASPSPSSTTPLPRAQG